MRVLACAAAALGLPLAILAYQQGPMPGLTGGFGEPTCQQCHTGQGLDDPAGKLRVVVPLTYRPASKYRITVSLERAGLKAGGFQLAARFRDGAGAGTQAGSLRAVDGHTQVVTGPGGRLQYAQHSGEGSEARPSGRMNWTVEWTPPKERRPVVFNVTANAANGDNSPLGDHIYAAAASSRPSPAR